MTDPDHTHAAELTGQVQRIVYSDPESGFTIAKITVAGQSHPVTVTGPLMAPPPGQTIALKGQWVDHPKFGRQFKAEHIESWIPTTQKGIVAYLGSGQIKGIGEQMAKRIVSRFGKATLDIIEHHPKRLQEVAGIGPKRIEQIIDAWKAQRHVRNVMLFMQSHGISAAYAAKIVKQYGQEAIAVVRQNPYRLADEIVGIGFTIADRIGANLGFAADAPLRLQAGILHVLGKLSDEGHLFFPCDALIDRAQSILNSGRDKIERAISELVRNKQLILESTDPENPRPSLYQSAVFLASLYRCESYVAQQLLKLNSAQGIHPSFNEAKAFAWIQHTLKVRLGDEQRRAVGAALRKKVLVITGGPGTGKTTIVRAITRLYEHLNARVLLAAPTGRAAKRLAEASGRPAKTIHRLLAYNPLQGRFGKNETNPLDAELLIVDETSMVDIRLMYYLLKAVRLSTSLILVGDANQLPSVGPGQVLKDILHSAIVPRVVLRKIYRQARHSRIVLNAHRINAGRMPQYDPSGPGKLSDYYFIEQQEPERILETILTLVSRRIPDKFGLDPVNDIQVLTPMHRGILGSTNLNQALQHVLNPQEGHVTRGDVRFGIDDKVMQTRNNYEKEIFNGDLGRITHIDPRRKKVVIDFDAASIDYDFNEMEEVILAYAISVHKSQGSEYPAVVIPVVTAHYLLLQRNLIYTALTRAKQLVVMVGTKRALAMAVKNDRPQHRHTLLAQRLNGGVA
jgi:exodeoxyribonuclease V alpha subunit